MRIVIYVVTILFSMAIGANYFPVTKTVKKVIYFEKPIQLKRKKVTITVYHANKKECDNNPSITALGNKIDLSNTYKHRYCAVSKDLRYLKNRSILITECGYLSGYYSVVDYMPSQHHATVDILINEDMKGGKWNGWIWY